MQKWVHSGMELVYLYHHLIALLVMNYPDQIRVRRQLTESDCQRHLDNVLFVHFKITDFLLLLLM